MLGKTVIKGLMPLGGSSRLTSYRCSLKEVLQAPFIETVNVDEYSACSCTTFERLLQERSLHLSNKVLEYAVFNISEDADDFLKEQMADVSQKKIFLEISENVRQIFDNQHGFELTMEQAERDRDIIHLLHEDDKELLEIVHECLDIEEMYYRLTENLAKKQRGKDIQVFLRKPRSQITKEEATHQRHNVRVLLGLSVDELVTPNWQSITNSWREWKITNDNIEEIEIAPDTFTGVNKQPFSMIDKPNLRSIIIKNNCFLSFTGFELNNLPSLTNLVIGESCFCRSDDISPFCISNCNKLSTISIGPASFIYFSSFTLKSKIKGDFSYSELDALTTLTIGSPDENSYNFRNTKTVVIECMSEIFDINIALPALTDISFGKRCFYNIANARFVSRSCNGSFNKIYRV